MSEFRACLHPHHPYQADQVFCAAGGYCICSAHVVGAADDRCDLCVFLHYVEFGHDGDRGHCQRAMIRQIFLATYVVAIIIAAAAGLPLFTLRHFRKPGAGKAGMLVLIWWVIYFWFLVNFITFANLPELWNQLAMGVYLRRVVEELIHLDINIIYLGRPMLALNCTTMPMTTMG